MYVNILLLRTLLLADPDWHKKLMETLSVDTNKLLDRKNCFNSSMYYLLTNGAYFDNSC